MDFELNLLIQNYGNFSQEIENISNNILKSFFRNPSKQTYNNVYNSCVNILEKLMKNTEELCNETIELLDQQNTTLKTLTEDEIDVNRELSSRKLVGERTIVKNTPISTNLVLPTDEYRVTKVLTPGLDIAKYDKIGHGVNSILNVPKLKTVYLKLEIPKELELEKFSELNQLDFSEDCVSYFWKRNIDESKSELMKNLTKRSYQSQNIKSYSSKTSKKNATIKKSLHATIKNNNLCTFRKRNSITNKVSAPNSVYENIYENLTPRSSQFKSPNIDYNEADLNFDFNYDISSIYSQPTNKSLDQDSSTSQINKENILQSEYVVNETSEVKTINESSFSIKNSVESIHQSSVKSFLYKAQVIYDYDKSLDDELSISVGQIVEVIDEGEDGWFFARLGEHEGSIPGNYIEKI